MKMTYIVGLLGSSKPLTQSWVFVFYPCRRAPALGCRSALSGFLKVWGTLRQAT